MLSENTNNEAPLPVGWVVYMEHYFSESLPADGEGKEGEPKPADTPAAEGKFIIWISCWREINN